MDKIFIEVLQIVNKEFIEVPLESALIIMLYKHFNCPHEISLKIMKTQTEYQPHLNFLKLKLEFLSCVEKFNELDDIQYDLKPPFLVHDDNYFISGFSAVCREMITRGASESYEYLLGFNKSCLQAPTETSSWTKFCELSLVNCFNDIMQQYSNPSQHIIEIPDTFKQFNNHLKEPLKINDKYKKDLKASKIIVNKDIKYSEYNHPTLVDILIYFTFQLSFEFLPKNITLEILKMLPQLAKWIDDVANYDENLFTIMEYTKCNISKIKAAESRFEKVYWLNEEPIDIFNKNYQSEKYKPINKVATVQANIVNSLKNLKVENLDISSETKFESNYSFDWKSISQEIHPHNGGVPDTRLQRKKDQLKCLIDILMTLTKDGETIVDFCSGSGHLGIILAQLLPQCKIVFLENKQFSLMTTKERSKKLNLKNCVFYQSNIDYFIGKFDIGISLHACGTATDVVLLKCIEKSAKFISCPCCYGSITPMPHISYPMSKIFKNILSEQDFLYLTHAADLNISSESDIHCMDVIDTDRKLLAQQMGYNCVLTRLSPENCTPKNRILIGTKRTFTI